MVGIRLICAWEDHEQNIRDDAVKNNGYLKKAKPSMLPVLTQRIQTPYIPSI